MSTEVADRFRTSSRQLILIGNPVDRVVLRSAVRLISSRRGNCIWPRKGMHAIASALLRIPMRRVLRAPTICDVPLNGPTSKFLASDWLVRWAWQPYDSLARLIEAILQYGDVAADVGAFTGWYAYLMAIRTGPAGQTHVVEANPFLKSVLSAYVGSVGGVSCHFVGAGAAEGVLPFNVNEGAAMSSFLWTQGKHDVIEVPVRRLDAELKEAIDSDRFVLMKLDVEGYELSVLQGLGQLLAGAQRPCIYLEMTEPTRAAAARTRSAVFDLLHDSGFELYMAPQYTWLKHVPLKWLATGPDPEVPGWNDALAVPVERKDELEKLIARGVVKVSSTY